MDGSELARFMRENEAALAAEAARRMKDEERMVDIAATRDMAPGEMGAQVVGFWLKAMATDLDLGVDAAVREGISWSLRMAGGHGLEFKTDLYQHVLETVFSVLVGHESLPAELVPVAETYRARTSALVAELTGGAS